MRSAPSARPKTEALLDGVERRREELRSEVAAAQPTYAREYAVEALLSLFDSTEYRRQPRMAARSLHQATAHALVSIALSLSQPSLPEHRNGNGR